MCPSQTFQSSIQHYFGQVQDDRVQGRCRHQLLDIIAIALLAVLAGADGWKAIETYGQAKQVWLLTFLELPNGIPSHDTFKGTIVSIDAMGTHAPMARQIPSGQADYILALKGNQGKLYKTARTWFEGDRGSPLEPEVESDFWKSVESAHHRLETREVWVFPAQEVFSPSVCSSGSGLQSLVVVRAQRLLWNKTTCETRFFLSSVSADAQSFAGYIRSHWGVENPLHWCLDVVFGEDSSRIRTDNAPRNFSLLRRWALNLLRQHPGRESIKMKRYRAGLDDAFLLDVLSHSLTQPLAQNAI